MAKNHGSSDKTREKAGRPVKHGLSRFHNLKWNDEREIDSLLTYLRENMDEDEYERLKLYLRTLAYDEDMDLTSFEIKRIALAMLMLDRADKWFLMNSSQNNWDELRIELQKFLQGKENLVINSLQKARENKGPKRKSLVEQLDDEFKGGWSLEGEHETEGVNYTFQAKKKKKPKMLKVEVVEDGDEDEEQSEEKEE